VKRWLKLVGVLLIAVVVVAVVSPDFDLQPTVARISQATQRPPGFAPGFAFVAIPTATFKDRGLHSTPSPLAFLFRSYGKLSANLIDLNCARLC